MNSDDRPRPYLLFSMGLSLLALVMLTAELVVPLRGSTLAVLATADQFLCILFLIDFLLLLRAAPNRWEYFRTWGWIDLLSSLPAIDLLRFGRAARIFRILRVLRGIRSARTLANIVLQYRAESGVLAAALVSILLLVISSISILHFETETTSNIQDAQDALWWSVTTITTVGYGDKFPVSWEGRILAALLMITGVGLFGTFSGFVASWFLEPRRQARASELELLRLEIQDLRRELAATRTHQGIPDEGDPGTDTLSPLRASE